MPPSPNFEMDHDSYVKYEVEDEGFGSDDGKQLKGCGGTMNNMVDTASQGVSAMTISATAMAILGPALNCAKSAALSLSPLAISTTMANHSPVTPAPSPSPELGDALSQLSIQLPESGMSKEISPSSTPTMTAPPSPIMKADAIFIGMAGERQPIIISTSKPTTPPVYITVIDNIAVYVMILKVTGFDKDYRLMRRVDTGYVNGTTLLVAGGIETESERSIVLSLEVGRMRVRKQSSELFGTWIPLRRAMALATSCSLRHKLGPFLDEDLDTHFPSPLPISLPMSHKSDLQALTLAALRNPTPTPRGGYFSHPLGPAAPIPQSGANTYLQQLLLNFPHQSVKYGNPPLKAPMLGCFDEDSRDDILFRRKEISIVSNQPALSLGSTRLSKSPPPPSSTCASTPPPHDLPTPEEGLSSHESEIDIVNNESDDNTDTDEDVEEVREHMKKIRAAAVDAMQNGGTDLNEIIGVATSAGTLDEDYDIDPVDWNREVMMPDGRRFAIKPHTGSESNGLGDNDHEDRDLETAQRATTEMTTGQRRRSATKWTGKNGICKVGLSRKIAGLNGQRPGRRGQVGPTASASMPTAMRIDEDEDEEIDIGGSDRDDDLR